MRTWNNTTGTGLVAVAMFFVLSPSFAAPPLNEQAVITQQDGVEQSMFGTSVCIDGTLAAVGVIGDSAGVYNSGAVIPFHSVADGWQQQNKLVASNLVSFGNFGSTVALRESILVVGAPGDDQRGADSGAVYAYLRKDGAWVSDGKLVPRDGAAGDGFGSALALDTDTLLAGAFADDDSGGASGSAYLFYKSGNEWKETGKLIAADGASEDFFGKAVAIHTSTAVVGAPGDDDGGIDAGSVYLFTNQSDKWAQTGKLVSDRPGAGAAFGSSVAIWGPYIAVGAPGEMAKFQGQGAVYVYVFDGTAWLQKMKLTAYEGKAGDAFGASVTMRGDYLLVGAPSRDEGVSDTGTVYVYQLIAGSWINTGKLLHQKPATTDEFGQALSTDGVKAIVGASKRDVSGANSGAAYIFDLTLIPTLTPTPTFTKPKPPTAIPTVAPTLTPTEKPTLTPSPTKAPPPPSTPTPPRPTEPPARFPNE